MLRILPTGIQSCSDSHDPERCAFIPSVGYTTLYPGALSLYAGSIALDFGDASLRLIVGPIIVITVK